MQNLITYNETATTVEQFNSKGTIYSIKLIINDGKEDLYIGLNKSTTNADNDYILLKAGESIEELNITPLSVLYFKAGANTTSFRVYGTSL